MRFRTPQEKKALSYAKDRRNTYGENDKASRKAIKMRRAHQHRSYRRAINSIVGMIGNLDPENIEHLAKSVERNGWKKYPDTPLGEVVASKLERRESRIGRGKTMRKAIREMSRTLKVGVDIGADGRWKAFAVDFPDLVAFGESRSIAVDTLRTLFEIALKNSLGSEIALLGDRNCG